MHALARWGRPRWTAVSLLRAQHTRALRIALQAHSAAAAQLQADAKRSSKQQQHPARSSGGLRCAASAGRTALSVCSVTLVTLGSCVRRSWLTGSRLQP